MQQARGKHVLSGMHAKGGGVDRGMGLVGRSEGERGGAGGRLRGEAFALAVSRRYWCQRGVTAWP